MKKFLIIIFLTILTLIYGLDYDFKKTKWGMTVEEVKKNEDIKRIEAVVKMGINAYRGKDQLFGESFTIEYIFEDKKLTEGNISLENYPFELEETFDIFNKLFNSLSEKYGDPDEKNMDFILYQSDQSKFLDKDYCKIECNWELEQTNVFLKNIYFEGESVLWIKYKQNNIINKQSEESLEISLGYKGKKGFRNSNWGLSIDEVKNRETLELIIDGGDILIYESKLIDIPCEIVYAFKAKVLSSGFYDFKPLQTKPGSLVDDFFNIKQKLISIYDLPSTDNSIQHQSTDNAHKTKLAISIYDGSEELLCTWKEGNTDIKLSLSNDNSDDFSLSLFFLHH